MAGKPLRRLRAFLAIALVALAAPAFAQATGENEPNLQVPAGSARYLPDAMPDRIIATPAQDPATGFAVNWRTNAWPSVWFACRD